MSWCDDGPCFQGSEYCPWCETEDHMEEIKRVHDTPPGGWDGRHDYLLRDEE